MANNVYNELVVSGALGELRLLIEFLGTRLDFDKIDPMPEHLWSAEREVRDHWIGEHWGASAAYLERREIVTTSSLTINPYSHMAPDFVLTRGGLVKGEDADLPLVRDDGTRKVNVEVTYCFLTKWAPAYPVVKRLSALFSKLTFSYSWDGEFPEMMTGHEIRCIGGEPRSRGKESQDKVIPEEHSPFAGYAWVFCEEHKVAWCNGKHWDTKEFDDELAEFRRRFGPITLASLSHAWESREPGFYRTNYFGDHNLLRGTLVHLLEARDEAAAELGNLHFGVHRGQLAPLLKVADDTLMPDDIDDYF